MHSQISTSYILHSIVSTSITHSLISRSSTLTPYYHIPLPYITTFVINANHPISQSTPSHLAMCQYVECHLLFLVLMPLVECWSVHMPHCLGKPSGVEHTTPHHTITMLHFVSFHGVTCYTTSLVARIRVNTTQLHNITCTLVATTGCDTTEIRV
jgi:hypothetical protein